MQNPFDAFDTLTAARPFSVVTAPADPGKPLTAQGTALSNQEKAATLPFAGPKAEADLRAAIAAAIKAEADAAKARAETAALPNPDLAQRIKDLQLDAMLHAVSQAQGYINGGKATGYTGALGRTFGMGTSANDLEAAIDTLKGNVMLDKLMELKSSSPTGASGLGALSEREGKMLTSVLASLDLRQSDTKLLDTLARIRGHALSLKAIQAGKNPDDPEVRKAFGIAAVGGQSAGTPPASGPGASSGGMDRTPQTVDGGGGGSQIALARGGTMADPNDPVLRGIDKHISGMIREGASQADVDAYTQSLGIPARYDVSAAIQFRDRNPTYTGAFPVRSDGRQVPMSMPRQVLNSAAQTPIGAYAMGATDVVSGGTLDNVTDNPALSRAGMAGVAEMNPLSTLAGQVTGAGLMGAGVQLGAARLGAGGLASVLAGDALPAIADGAGSADDETRLAGAAVGGLAGVGGGAVGRGLGRLISGVGDSAVQRLSQDGIRLSPGQLFGGVARTVEDRFAGLPFIGDAINVVRRNGLRDANAARFNEALEPIAATVNNQVGEAGVDQSLDAVSNAYRQALAGVTVQADAPYLTGMTGLSRNVASVPRVGQELHQAMSEIITPMFNNGRLSGESFQAIDRGLQQLRASYRTDPLFSTHIAPAIDAAEGHIEGMIARQAPDVLPAYTAAKGAYRNTSVLADAVNTAVNQRQPGGEALFTAAQLGRAARDNTKKFGGRNAAARGDRPFAQSQADMQEVLPAVIPDSGTAGRALVAGALPATLGAILGGGRGAVGAPEGQGMSAAGEGAGTGLVGGLALTGALASPYLARPLLQRAITANRPQAIRVVGDYLTRARLPGALAVPLLAGGE